MRETEKLRVLLSHWIEHNQGHAQEFQRWIGEVEDVEGELQQAVRLMGRVNDALKEVLAALGGPLEGHGHHHHHHE